MPSPYGNSPPRAIKVAAVVPMYLPFAELRDNACRHEITNATEARDYRFCGLPAVPRRPFCEAHCDVAYMLVAPPMKRRGASTMPIAA